MMYKIRPKIYLCCTKFKDKMNYYRLKNKTSKTSNLKLFRPYPK